MAKRKKKQPAFVVLGKAEDGFRMFAADYEGYQCHVWTGEDRDGEEGVSFCRHQGDEYYDADAQEDWYRKRGSTIEVWIEDGEVRAR